MSEPSSYSANMPRSGGAEPTRTSISLLRDSCYDELEARMSEVQRAFEANRLSEVQLKRAFSAFGMPDAALGERLGGWVAAFPQSYPAHVALGRWLLARAWEFRGETTSDLVSDRGRRGLAYYLGEAGSCAAFAVTLCASPLAAQLLQGDVERTHGNDLTLEDVQQQRFPAWYLNGSAQNPHSYLLRSDLLRSLRTEWGGSDEMMLAYVRAVEAELSGAQRQRLWAQYHAQLTHYALHFSKDDDRAITHARMAAELDGSGSQILLVATAFLPPAVSGGQAARLAALEQVMTYLEHAPDAQLGGNTTAALDHMERAKDPVYSPRLISLLTRLADEGDDEAGQALGLLAIRHKQQGLDPVPVLTRLMDAGHSRAATLLVAYHETAPVDTDALEQTLLRGADLGNDFCAAQVYRRWSRLQPKYKLADRDKYRYLLMAADNGDNDARVDLAEGLRRGQLELGDDNKLRPYAGSPLQESLDYAKHMLERASHEDSRRARTLLNSAKPAHWQEGSKQVAAYMKSNSTPGQGRYAFNWRSTLWFWIALAVLKLLVVLFGHSG